jgi:hypothetical protein
MLRVCIGSGSISKSKFGVLMRQTEWGRDGGRWNGGKKVADVRNERKKYVIERHKEHESIKKTKGLKK